jgi:hypothetical protein
LDPNNRFQWSFLIIEIQFIAAVLTITQTIVTACSNHLNDYCSLLQPPERLLHLVVIIQMVAANYNNHLNDCYSLCKHLDDCKSLSQSSELLL